MIHKKRPMAWHRNGNIAPCGKRLRKEFNSQTYGKKLDVAKYSTYWKDVTCSECLKFLYVVKVESINKFKEKK